MTRSLSTVLLALLLLAGPAAAQAQDATGQWDTLVNAPDGPHRGSLTLVKNGETLTGTIGESGAPMKVTGTQKGADVTLSFTFQSPDGPIAITLKGVQRGDAIAGPATFGDDQGDWSAKRTPPASGSAAATAAALDVSGEWLFEVTTGAGSGTPAITLHQNGETLSGRYVGQLGDAPVQGMLKGAQISLSFDVAVQDVKLHVVYSGTASKDSMKGTVALGDLGEGTFTARRK